MGRILDLLLPPRCLSCGVELTSDSGLCPPCWAQAHFISAPFCACCGLPFEQPEPPERVCVACAAAPPGFDRARAALIYDDGSRALLLRFKHGGHGAAAAVMTRWMAAAAGPLLQEAELIAPVPLHRWRLFRRGYNQAALLARRLAATAGVPVIPDALIRRKATPALGPLGRRARRRALVGAVAAHPDRVSQIAGRRVLLIDDVLTTGATAAACARALRRAGAVRVDVLTAARAVLTQSP